MKRLLLLGLLVLGIGLVQAENLPDFTDIVDHESNTVVNISAITKAPAEGETNSKVPEHDPMLEFFRNFGIPVPEMGPQGSGMESSSMGSGFIIRPDGYILTNGHVVQGADEVTVKLLDKREFKAKVIGIDPKTDVALLKIDATGLPTVKAGDPAKARVGEWVVAIGAPFGFESTVTKGIISAKGRSLPQETLVPFIQTDVPINPGNSGGPLFDMKGEVIGINSQIYSRTGGYMGLSFAIPIDVALQVADELRLHGKVSRGWLGVVIQEVSKELADSFGLPKAEGALVVSVQKGSPAERAGIQPGDIILRFDGKTVNNQTDLPRIVSSVKSGSGVSAVIWRKGAERSLQVLVGNMPAEKIARGEGRGTTHGGKPTGPAVRLGLAVTDPGEGQEGVVIEGVRGEAAQVGLEPGDQILSLNNNECHSVREFNQLVEKIKGPVRVALLVKRGDSPPEFVTLPLQ
ncbi:Do family serine endopeptidase [Ferrovum myxofaciens]|jgi:serine protease Do|uniref:Do family serine endopeptidase n=1 Tax=Ferrovum myxofaciens TaxID=416213 RepID=UPI0004E28AE2|nr:Do family serine endopeptidase [Ferrovum myxofaciens]